MKVQKTVLIDPELAIWARQKGINMSGTLNNVLRELKRIRDGSSDEPVETIARNLILERDESVSQTIKTQAEEATNQKEKELIDLQPHWNQYLSTGDKPIQAKLSWIRSRLSRYPMLRAMQPEAVLEELEG